jgi:hypothetical protein
MIRAALYGRYSFEGQREASIIDQSAHTLSLTHIRLIYVLAKRATEEFRPEGSHVTAED